MQQRQNRGAVVAPLGRFGMFRISHATEGAFLLQSPESQTMCADSVCFVCGKHGTAMSGISRAIPCGEASPRVAILTSESLSSFCGQSDRPTGEMPFYLRARESTRENICRDAQRKQRLQRIHKSGGVT